MMSDDNACKSNACKVIMEVSDYLQGQLMNLRMPISSNPYMLSCWKSRINPTLILHSSIFEDT